MSPIWVSGALGARWVVVGSCHDPLARMALKEALAVAGVMGYLCKMDWLACYMVALVD